MDVGSLLNIGWWRELTGSDQSTNGRDLDGVAVAVVADIRDGIPVAPGFEAPLFVPRPSEPASLNRPRVGEKGRPWSAGAGTIALAIGIQQSAYVFEKIAAEVRPRVTFDVELLGNGGADLLVWEAFVSGDAKDGAASNPHVDDARVVAQEFARRFAEGHVSSDLDDTEVLSVVAAGLLSAGLSSDIGLISQSCIVVKPNGLAPNAAT